MIFKIADALSLSSISVLICFNLSVTNTITYAKWLQELENVWFHYWKYNKMKYAENTIKNFILVCFVIGKNIYIFIHIHIYVVCTCRNFGLQIMSGTVIVWGNILI